MAKSGENVTLKTLIKHQYFLKWQIKVTLNADFEGKTTNFEAKTMLTKHNSIAGMCTPKRDFQIGAYAQF
jgi:hypothetical protein